MQIFAYWGMSKVEKGRTLSSFSHESERASNDERLFLHNWFPEEPHSPLIQVQNSQLIQLAVLDCYSIQDHFGLDYARWTPPHLLAHTPWEKDWRTAAFAAFSLPSPFLWFFFNATLNMPRLTPPRTRYTLDNHGDHSWRTTWIQGNSPCPQRIHNWRLSSEEEGIAAGISCLVHHPSFPPASLQAAVRWSWEVSHKGSVLRPCHRTSEEKRPQLSGREQTLYAECPPSTAWTGKDPTLKP